MPPLRERREDIPSLVEFFLQRFTANNGYVVSAISPEALAARRTSKGAAWHRETSEGFLSNIDIASRGGQNHRFSREEIAVRFREAFNTALW